MRLWWGAFIDQYRHCRERELTRPLGRLHAIRHGIKTATYVVRRHRGRR